MILNISIIAAQLKYSNMRFRNQKLLSDGNLSQLEFDIRMDEC